MARAEDVARGFTIAGLLDEGARTQKRYPVREIPVEDIADHPENVAYSMDSEGVAALARSIREQGLTDLPLVRKLADGSFQMVSGHRRKAAFALLAQEDPAFSKIPCRIAEGMGDADSVAILHAANYFTRQLNPLERARASRALGVQADRMREEVPELTGARTEDIKAAIISAQTGRSVSGKTIRRQEALADAIEDGLDIAWRGAAVEERIPAEAVRILAKQSPHVQRELYGKWHAAGVPKQRTASFLRAELNPRRADAHLEKALSLLEIYERCRPRKPSGDDIEALERIARLSRKLASGAS